MNTRSRSILRTHGYTRRHIKAWQCGAVTFNEFISEPAVAPWCIEYTVPKQSYAVTATMSPPRR